MALYMQQYDSQESVMPIIELGLLAVGGYLAGTIARMGIGLFYERLMIWRSARRLGLRDK
jgi:hypothetical protein